MPELPEVESLRRFVESRLAGLTIERVELSAFSALKTFDPPLDALKGAEVLRARRQGKYLIFDVSSQDSELSMVVHLSRGGWMQWQEELTATKAKPGKGPLALRLGFSDGSGVNFTEAGTEKRLAIWLVRNLDAIENVRTLGPDPLEVTLDEIVGAITKHGSQIKKVLTDQKVLAGVGNAYSDEALHIAKLSPFKTASKLSPEEAHRLAEAIVDVLTDAVERSEGVAVAGLKKEKKSGMRVHGKTGQRCPECGDVIREVSFSAKSLQYCATCQTGGKPLADRRMSRLLK